MTETLRKIDALIEAHSDKDQQRLIAALALVPLLAALSAYDPDNDPFDTVRAALPLLETAREPRSDD